MVKVVMTPIVEQPSLKYVLGKNNSFFYKQVPKYFETAQREKLLDGVYEMSKQNPGLNGIIEFGLPTKGKRGDIISVRYKETENSKSFTRLFSLSKGNIKRFLAHLIKKGSSNNLIPVVNPRFF